MTSTTLSKSNEKISGLGYSELFVIAPYPVFVSNDTGVIVSVNPAACDYLGYSAEELIGRETRIIFHPDYSDRNLSLTHQMSAGSPDGEDCKFIRKDGSVVWGEVIAGALSESLSVLFVRDKTPARIAEDLLVQSEERYRAFIEQSSEGIWRFEVEPAISIRLPASDQIDLFYKNGFMAECNDAMARQYGLEKASELVGKGVGYMLHRDNPEHQQYLLSFIESNYKLKDSETVEIDEFGNELHILNNLVGIVEYEKLVRVWGTQIDATPIRQAEKAVQEVREKQRQAGKVEAIGRLAGGIAHDFNNLLAVIMLHVDMLNLQLPAESSLRFRIQEIKSVTKNAAGMVRQLLAFGRKQTLRPHSVILNQVVKEFIKVLRPLVGEDNEIKLDLDPELGICFVDHHQISEVLMNLAVNARDSMPDGGTIMISTANLEIGSDSVHHKAQPEGSYIQLSVRDTGGGIDQEVIEKVFEPFYSTKETIKGTGLGLATVYGIVKQSNGFIWVESEKDQGTCFSIQFPRIDQPAEIRDVNKTPTFDGGTETILLVEDEDQIRNAAVEVLTILGYEVFEASGGKQAIQLAELYQKKIHLLLTDVVMPRMNGREVADHVIASHPETKVLFMSGYTDDIISKHGVLEPGVHFLNKPFSPAVLATKIREILDS